MSALVLNSGCTHVPVLEVEPCIEIPFLDSPEGACTNTVTHKNYLVDAVGWRKERMTMIMLRAKDWTKIKLQWLEGCRMLPSPDDCNVQVDSVDRAIKALSQMAGQMIQP